MEEYFVHESSGEEKTKKTLIKEGVNAMIVCGHIVGKCAMVEADAVVTKDVPDYALVARAPAKVVSKVDEFGMIVEE